MSVTTTDSQPVVMVPVPVEVIVPDAGGTTPDKNDVH
jgi:hypothetical protein